MTTVAIYFGEDEELVRRLKAYNLVSFWTSAEVAVWTQKPEEGNGPKFSHKELSISVISKIFYHCGSDALSKLWAVYWSEKGGQ